MTKADFIIKESNYHFNKSMWIIWLYVIFYNFKNSDTTCSTGWNYFLGNGRCYTLIKSMKSQMQAYEHCLTLDAYLAMPKTTEEMSFLAGNVVDQPGLYIWVGINSFSIDGSWQFMDGYKVNNNAYQNNPWHSGEPVSPSGCAMFLGNGQNYKFAVKDCTWNFWFICQRPISSIEYSSFPPQRFSPCGSVEDTYPPACPPDSGWSKPPAGSVCYKAFSITLSHNYSAAVALCNDHGYDIIMPRYLSDLAYLSILFKQHSTNKIWIGFARRYSLMFVWDAGDQTNYPTFVPGEPNSYEPCSVYAKHTSTGYYHLYGNTCDQTHIVYCQNTAFFQSKETTSKYSTTGMLTTEGYETTVTTKICETTTTTKSETTSISETTTTTQPETTAIYKTTETTQTETTLIQTNGTIDTTFQDVTTRSTNIITQQNTRQSTLLSTLSDVTMETYSSTTNKESFNFGLCSCECGGNITKITSSELEQRLINIKNTLHIDPKNVSRSQRQLKSAHDSRVSAMSIGILGGTVLIFSFLTLSFFDLLSLFGVKRIYKL